MNRLFSASLTGWRGLAVAGILGLALSNAGCDDFDLDIDIDLNNGSRSSGWSWANPASYLPEIYIFEETTYFEETFSSSSWWW